MLNEEGVKEIIERTVVANEQRTQFVKVFFSQEDHSRITKDGKKMKNQLENDKRRMKARGKSGLE
uniref:Uncharacterized protein n=1 Tax=Pristionchus pacificus TaxID=54126 RepID=A0A2A6BHM9_PRIPA